MLIIFAIVVFAAAVYMVLDAVTVRQKQIATKARIVSTNWSELYDIPLQKHT